MKANIQHNEIKNDYVDRLNSTLVINNVQHKFLVLDLFAGCGGLSLGFEAQGFKTIGYEMNADCCNTYNKNLSGKCKEVFLTDNTDYPNADIIIGGPPCQPFSVGGKQKGIDDSRNGFPAFIAAVKKVKPKIFLIENVRGLLYKNKSYLDEIIKQLESLGYIVDYKLINALNFDVPQNRERVIIIGHKGDFHFPNALDKKITCGEALGELVSLIPPNAKFLTPNMDRYIANYEKASKCVNPRDLNLEKPARTLTCRNLAGATGDMQRIRLSDGRRRRLSMREAARLQSFPDWFEFEGGDDSVFNQIGNAVPPFLSYYLAGSMYAYLNSLEISETKLTLDTQRQNIQFTLSDIIQENDVVKYIDETSKCKTFINKPSYLKQLINEALFVINNLGIPLNNMTDRSLERMAMAFLAVIDVKTTDEWKFAKDLNDNRSMKSRDIIIFWNEYFEENVSSGSYDDIRRKDLLYLVTANIIVKSMPNAAINNPSRGYSLNPLYSNIVRSYGHENWVELANSLVSQFGNLKEKLDQKRNLEKVKITMPDGCTLEFSNGEHNILQKSIIEDFLPRFGFGAELLYVGDTAKKHIIYEKQKLEELGFFELDHGELPDVIAYSKSKNWLFVIEAVYSCNPVTIIRKLKIEELTKGCSASVVYVSAFLDKKTFLSFASEIAWETEAWIASAPDHMVHFNGDKFLGPYKKD